VRVVSANALRAMLAQETGEVFLVCITLSHSSFAQPYLLVSDQKPLVRTAGTFQPFAFGIKFPDESEDQLPSVQMILDNVDPAILSAIRTIGAERPSVKVEAVLASQPNTVEAQFTFAILSIDYNAATITGTLGFEEDVLNTPFPSGTYTPTNSPGLFV
jgi:hypothetical protein